jgi:tRNA G18 (ribose-2'-O)-methylase SpoU
MRKLENSELNRLSIDGFKESAKHSIVIVLDDIRSMHNIGSVFRTADSFRLESILLCGITATPPHREIQKTALGATESVDWKYFGDILEAIVYLKQAGYKIISVEQVENSLILTDFKPHPDQKYAFVFGNEIKGVKQEVINSSDICIEIPQFGTKHSLNISVCAGIVIWDIITKLQNTH